MPELDNRQLEEVDVAGRNRLLIHHLARDVEQMDIDFVKVRQLILARRVQPHLPLPAEHVERQSRALRAFGDRQIQFGGSHRGVGRADMHHAAVLDAVQVVEALDACRAVELDDEVVVFADLLAHISALPMRALVAAEIEHLERAAVGDAEHALAGCVDGESTEVRTDPAPV